MKKIYLSLLAASLVTGAVAQNVNNIQPIKKNVEIGNKSKESNVGSVKGAIVWSNTMDDITDWTLTNSSVPSLNWSIETNPAAIPVTALSPAAFTSVSDGYAFIDSDAAGETATQNANMTLAAPIDLAAVSSAANFSLVFENSYRIFQDTRIVRVSGDNGATWTDYTITDGTNSNTNTANPELVSLNISSDVIIAGTPSTQVLIEFNYQGAWGWYWAIDDVRIVETDDNDLKLESNSFGTIGTYGARLPYYQIPVDQIAPIEFFSVIKNVGALDQTNAITTQTVNGGVFTGTSTGITSVINAVDTLFVTNQYTPAASVGSHNVSVVISMDNTDDDLSNNNGTNAFAVTQDIYARDNGTIQGGTFNSGNAYEVGNVFDIFQNQDMYSIDVTITTTSAGSPLIYGKVYSIDAGGNFVFESQSDDYSVTSAEISAGATISLPLPSPLTLNAGTSYLVVVGAYGDGGSTNDLVTATAGDSEAQTTFYLDGTDGTWYYTTSTPVVRINFDPSVSVEDEVANITVGQNFPNPFNGNTTVNYELNSTETVTVEITDITGKVIAVMNEGVRTAGSHVLTINSNNLAAGTYYYTLSTSKGKVTKAMTIAK